MGARREGARVEVWSARERRAAGIVAAVAVLIVVAIKAWIRPSARELGLEDFGLLGWAPSFLTAFAVPYLLVARDGIAPVGPAGRGTFVEACFWSLLIVWGFEIMGLLLVGAVFDAGDLIAALLGIAVAGGIRGAVLPRRLERRLT